MEPSRPTTLQSLPLVPAVHPELRDLRVLADSGFPVAAVSIVPAAAEEQYYRLNNLASRLTAIFSGVNIDDPDDDDIDELAPEAHRTALGHFLLDEFIDSFYEATAFLPGNVRVRRPGTDGTTSTRGRGSLLEVKRTWAADWTFDAIWQRLREDAVLLPAPLPVLIHSAALRPLPGEVSTDASALLGHPVRLLGDPEAGITRLAAPESQ